MLSFVMKICSKNNSRNDGFIFDLQFQFSILGKAQQQQYEAPGHTAARVRKLQQQCEVPSHIGTRVRKLQQRCVVPLHIAVTVRKKG